MDEKEREDLRNKNIKLLDHDYDGIQEFDQKLPNWWLFSLYGAIIFSVLYWVVRHQWMDGQYDFDKLENQLAMVEDARLEATLQMLDNDTLVAFSKNEEWISNGAATYTTNCVACHGTDLTAMVSGINLPGVNLVDDEWIHGSNPTDIYNVIAKGVPAKGMQAWEGQLGPKRIAEVVAYLLSQQS